MKQHRLLIFLSFLTLLLFLLHPAAAAGGVQNGLHICAAAIIPSLYVYAVLSGILMRLLPSKSTGNDRPSLLIFLFGSLCGFPIGAELCKNIDLENERIFPNTEWLLASVNLASPAYVISTVGFCGFHSKKIGIILYLCQVSIAFLFFCLVRTGGAHKQTAGAPADIDFSDILFESVESAVNNIFKICGILCFFSALLSVLADLPLTSEKLILPLSVCLEISNGVMQCAKLYPQSPIFAIGAAAFCCGFSGLCVQLQIISVLKNFHIKLYKLCFYKLLFGTLCAVSSIFLCKIFGYT